MPITAFLGNEALVSTELSQADFDGLRGETQLQFRCGVRAIPRRSGAGFPHFYHQSLAECDFPHTNPETDEHRAIKSAIIRGALAAGWSAEEEFPNEDRTWIADVLVYNGSRRIAFEAQWSKQDDEQFRGRTDRYKDARMETVWFYRHADPHDVARHGLIPVQKRSDGIIVTHGTSEEDQQTIEDAVEAILRRTAWWKFPSSFPQVTVHRWFAVPCIACGVVNVCSIDRERRISCTRCLKLITSRMDADLAQARIAAAEAGFPEVANLAGTACGACEHQIGPWAIEVGQKVATFRHIHDSDGPLPAHWCIPGHEVNTYADAVSALTTPAAPRPATALLRSTHAAKVRKDIAEVERRLQKGAQSIREKQEEARKKEERKAFLASPAGEQWLRKKRSEEQSRRDKEAHRLRLAFAEQQRAEEERRTKEFAEAEAARSAAGQLTIRETHERTMLFRERLRLNGSAALDLVEQHGQLAERCPCTDCEDFRSRLSAHTINALFTT
ncbi:competence protein CoiA family protein [Salinibacterium sp. GXW1014]|uniref:competence protein CoiA family protein n=1 Tax=Salinibacterium sp. GXW1014 TaxID=3377838 RepID=UPI00383AD89A